MTDAAFNEHHPNSLDANLTDTQGLSNDTWWESECGFFYADCCLDSGNESVVCGNETFYVSDYNSSSPYLMPWPQRTGWIAIFAVMLAVATVGNALVAWIVFGNFGASRHGRIRFGPSRLALTRFLSIERALLAPM